MYFCKVKKIVGIHKAIEILKNGGLVAIPTETVYGLAANALNEDAVQNIFLTKGRPSNNPLILHFLKWDDAKQYVNNVPDDFYKLYSNFSPGPITYLLPKSALVSEKISANNSTVAVRFPLHPVTQELLKNINFPLAAPSANPSGYISPTQSIHVINQLGDKIGGVLEGGECVKGIESTIVGWDVEGNVMIYRSGTITAKEISDILQKEVKVVTGEHKKNIAPGMLSKHYSPKKPTYITNDVRSKIHKFSEKKIGIIWQNKSDYSGFNECVNLSFSESGKLETIAKNLYATMYQMDNLDVDVILIEKCLEDDLGLAIADRLSRAGINLDV
jgi:L-threonylcarbamoyladenylate synthase